MMNRNGISSNARPAPSTSIMYESPEEVLARKRQQRGIGQLGTYQPNGPSKQPSIGSGLPTPNQVQPPGGGSATTNVNTVPRVVEPTTAGTLSGQLATQGGLGNATVQNGPTQYNNPNYYRTPHIPGAWQSLGNGQAHTREEANSGWQPQLGSPGWWQAGGASKLPPVSTEAPLDNPTGETNVIPAAEPNDAQTRLASHVRAGERNNGYHATQPVNEQERFNQAGQGLSIGSQSSGLTQQTQAQPDPDTVTTPAAPQTISHEPNAPWAPQIGYNDGRNGGYANFYRTNWAAISQALTDAGADAADVEAIRAALQAGLITIESDGTIQDASELGDFGNTGEGNIFTGGLASVDPDLAAKINLLSKQDARANPQAAQPTPEDQAKQEEEAAWQDLLKFLTDSRGAGQISEDTINNEIAANQQSRAKETGQGTWAALELANRTGATPEATSGTVAQIGQQSAIQGAQLDSQVRMQREYYNAQRESEWASQMAQALTILAQRQTNDVVRNEMLQQAKEMAALQSKLGIKMMYIQDQLNTPSASEVIGSIFGNLGQAVGGSFFGGLGGGLSKRLVGA